MLLLSDHNLRHFNPATILEIWLYPPENDPEKAKKAVAIYFIAKYIRHDGEKMIGVKISDIEPEARARYNEFLTKHQSGEV